MLSQHSEEMIKLPTRVDNVNHNGVLFWKINNYTELYNESLNQEEGQKCIESDAFYTEDGYKMRVLLYPNGVYTSPGLTGDHMSLFIQILKHDNIETLDWPFNHNVSMAVMSQEDDYRNHTRALTKQNGRDAFKKPISGDNFPIGFHGFIYASWLLEAPFMKDDSIIIKVVVVKPDPCVRKQ
jgi:hypothetical protein